MLGTRKVGNREPLTHWQLTNQPCQNGPQSCTHWSSKLQPPTPETDTLTKRLPGHVNVFFIFYAFNSVFPFKKIFYTAKYSAY